MKQIKFKEYREIVESALDEVEAAAGKASAIEEMWADWFLDTLKYKMREHKE